jgi:tRNA 2-thiouridine synthesizing protein B
MSTLHTVNKSPFSHKTLSSCVTCCNPGDAILLLEDGVLGALEASPLAKELTALDQQQIDIYVLENDIKARGLAEKIMSQSKLIDYDGFVALTLKHQRIQSWY